MRFLHHFRYRTADLERRSKTALSTVSRGQSTWKLCACVIGFHVGRARVCSGRWRNSKHRSL